ncbi:SPRY domain-containing protein [Colletotrichum truncatum]|uniref:SPRY domain-containing protein n=1 Tax=Colletotrichum truncatum TaxID=5467 RepID=A0ACC3YTV3_COLTU|nr:SPRY domain-containing protein [Colletotrichum truncatum]KAF6798578.1 SPRY domain-containing protein [Colletotrichum truncatum]
MCFGSKADKDDSPAPRPAQRPPSAQQQQQDIKMSSNQRPQYAPTTGPPPGQSSSETYAPPPGPPPSQSYAAPSGPPPSQSYAPPSGPPPGRGEDDFAPPAGPPPSQSYAAPSGPPPSHEDYAPPSGPPPSHGDYAPPSGPPPSHDYAPPPGPPPSQPQGDFAPPAGPPPSHHDYTAPPPGPPPSQSQPKHDWEVAVPDTSLFPPPPAFFSGFDRSPANNSTEQEAEAGEAWVAKYPLVQPIHLDPAALEALRANRISLLQPQGFRGSLNQVAPGVWEASTPKNAPDGTIIGYPPLYSVRNHSPLATGRQFTAYYEVQIRESGAKEVDVALGFTALPYPNFRLPGWHRGSLAVHGDDGHKYINDRWGGKSFTTPFRIGERLGVGMTFSANDGRINVDIFLTRDGRLSGSWNLHEEIDAEQDGPVTGLEGYHDLSCAVGSFNRNIYEIIFEPSRWKYQP